MKAGQAIVKIMEDEGIRDAFGIPGAGINALYQYMGESKLIAHHTMRHEEAAVHAADAYCRASGNMAAALCTSGPGATNFVTGIYTANIDSIPLLALTGQAVTAQLGKDAFQCVPIAEICKPIAKATYCVTNAADVVKVMREAFQVARSGKPGPVVVDLPLDIQMAEVGDDLGKSPPIEAPAADAKLIADSMALLDGAKNPVMILGGGAILSGAEKVCLEFAELLQMPVITTYMAKGGLPENHPLNAGHAGIQVGQPIGNNTLLAADVVLGVGCRFTDRHTGAIAAYRGDRKFIHINIEKSEIGKIFPADIGIVADAKKAIEALLAAAKTKGRRKTSDWVAALPQRKAELARKTDYQSFPIKPQRVFEEINACFDDETIFTTGCGLNQIWSGQLQKIDKPRKYLPSGGAGTLGFDIPAAFGAMVACPGKRAVAVMGDFGFTFMVEELAVAAAYKKPVIVVILNNAYLSLIRQNQKYAYSYEYAVRMKENHDMVDYPMVARGLGCDGERVFRAEDIRAAFERALASDKPYIIDIITEEGTDCSMGGAIDAVKEFV